MWLNNIFVWSGLVCAAMLALFAVAPPKRGVMRRWLRVWYGLLLVVNGTLVVFAHSLNMSRPVALAAVTPGSFFILLMVLAFRYGPPGDIKSTPKAPAGRDI
jgi:hypothetical protein